MHSPQKLIDVCTSFKGCLKNHLKEDPVKITSMCSEDITDQTAKGLTRTAAICIEEVGQKNYKHEYVKYNFEEYAAKADEHTILYTLEYPIGKIRTFTLNFDVEETKKKIN